MFDVSIKSSFHPISRPVAELSCLISRFCDGFVTPMPKKCVTNLARLTTTKSDDTSGVDSDGLKFGLLADSLLWIHPSIDSQIM